MNLTCNKCGLNLGWLATKSHYFFLNSDGNIALSDKKNKYGYKVRFKCNNINCKAERNIYFKDKITPTKIASVESGSQK
jgi:hypothetical protein